jgi:type II secretory pathway pseudopilin PulG
MILRRLASHLRAQNWSAIAVELVILILGVFLGILAANWNQERLERREARILLNQLDVELGAFLSYISSVRTYYAAAGNYADRALAGWQNDRSVDDNEFVIAAYQASQVTGVGLNADVWSAIFGAEQLRDIEDLETRQRVAAVMSFDYELTDLRSVASRYREEVRKTIPNDIQAAIRQQCGDRILDRGLLLLPEKCALRLPPADAANAARALRVRSDLPAELHWHRAMVANQLAQTGILEDNARILTTRIGPDR